LPELFPLHSQDPCVFNEHVAADDIISVAIIKESCGSHGVMFWSILGFTNYIQKNTLALVPWICTHTYTHMSHLTKILSHRHIRNFLVKLNTSHHGSFLI